jgi:glycyl-tRNA synthetase (class II)
VTVRDRDSLAQERVAIDALAEELRRRLEAPWRTPKPQAGTSQADPTAA